MLKVTCYSISHWIYFLIKQSTESITAFYPLRKKKKKKSNSKNIKINLIRDILKFSHLFFMQFENTQIRFDFSMNYSFNTRCRLNLYTFPFLHCRETVIDWSTVRCTIHQAHSINPALCAIMVDISSTELSKREQYALHYDFYYLKEASRLGGIEWIWSRKRPLKRNKMCK